MSKIPIKCSKAENKLTVYLHCTIYTLLLCNLKLVFMLSPYNTFFQILRVVMKQQRSSSGRLSRFLCFTVREQDAH